MIFLKNKAYRDVLYAAIPQITLALSNLAIVTMVAQKLGPSAMGSYALILSVTTFITTLTDSGIGQSALKFASNAAAKRNETERCTILRSALHLRITIFLIVLLIALQTLPWILSEYWKDTASIELFYISLAIPFFALFSTMPTLYYQSGRHFGISATIASSQGILIVVAVYIVYYMRSIDLENIILATLIVAFLHSIISSISIPFATLWNLESKSFDFNRKNKLLDLIRCKNGKEKDQYVFTMLIVASTLICAISTRIDVWLLGYYESKSSLGIYSVASRVTLPLAIALGAINAALWPRVSSLDDRDHVKLLLVKLFKPVSAAVLLGVIYSVCAPYIIPVVFGSQFDSAIFLSQLLCFRFCVAMFVCPLGVVGYGMGLASKYLIVNLIQLICVLVINFLLIPRIGYYAAATALLCNEFVGFGLISMYVYARCKENSANISQHC